MDLLGIWVLLGTKANISLNIVPLGRDRFIVMILLKLYACNDASKRIINALDRHILELLNRAQFFKSQRTYHEILHRTKSDILVVQCK